MGHPIAAIATGHGRSGIGILRMSGEGSISLAAKVFSRADGKPLEAAEDRKLVLGAVVAQLQTAILQIPCQIRPLLQQVVNDLPQRRFRRCFRLHLIAHDNSASKTGFSCSSRFSYRSSGVSSANACSSLKSCEQSHSPIAAGESFRFSCGKVLSASSNFRRAWAQ